MKIRYIERIQLDSWRQIHEEREINAVDVWDVSGTGLTYVRLNEFNITSIATSDILEIIR